MHKTKKNKANKKRTLKKRSKCVYTDEAKRIMKQIKLLKLKVDVVKKTNKTQKKN